MYCRKGSYDVCTTKLIEHGTKYYNLDIATKQTAAECTIGKEN